MTYHGKLFLFLLPALCKPIKEPLPSPPLPSIKSLPSPPLNQTLLKCREFYTLKGFILLNVSMQRSTKLQDELEKIPNLSMALRSQPN